MWFEAGKFSKDLLLKNEGNLNLPMWTYGPRGAVSRPRMAMINDVARNKHLIESLKQVSAGSEENSTALCLGDFSLLPLLLSKLSEFKGRIVTHEKSELARVGLFNMCKHNGVSSEKLQISFAESLQVLKNELKGRKVTHLICEPFFTSSYLPWHDLYFWYARSELDLPPETRIMPARSHLWGVGVQFRDLHKIRAPVGKVEGFDVSLMDQMIDSALGMFLCLF